MDDWPTFSLFVAASLALIIAPGPDLLYVLARGIAQGRRAGLLSAAGVTLGILVHTLLAALGLAVLLQTSALAFMLVKYVGAAYLVYLGVKAFRDKDGFAPQAHRQAASGRVIFWQGVLSNVLNPKVALFFLAFLPQFVHENGVHPAVQMIGLGLLFAGMGVVFLCFLGYFAGSVGHWLQHRPAVAARMRWVTGGIFLLLGLRLAFLERR